MARPKSFDEDTALDAAAQLFWSHGYDGTSIADLEAHLGIGRQSLYNTFGDKRQLFLKALERYTGWNGERLAQSLFAPGAGLQTIRRYFQELVEFVTPEGPRRGCMVANSILEVGESDEGIARRCQANQEQVLRGFTHALTNAARDGDLREGLDVGAAAHVLMSQTYGIVVLSKAGVSRSDLTRSVRQLLASLE